MRLQDYPKPPNDTGLGIHASASVNFPLGEVADDYGWWLDEMEAMGVKWVKLLTGGGPNPSALGAARAILARGMMPIIRPYRASPAPDSLFDTAPEFRQGLQILIDAGCRYIETDKNEPNLLDEWKGGWVGDGSSPWEQGAQPDRVAESWVHDAAIIADMGGLPGLPPCAPGGNYNDIDFFRTMLAWLKQHGYAPIMERGVWISLHNATFNHPLDYPYDPVNRLALPVQPGEWDAHSWALPTEAAVNAERVRGKNPTQTLLSVDANGKDMGGSNCWRKFEALEALFEQAFGFQVPVLSTEGGIWEGAQNSPDPRYPVNGLQDVADVTVAFSKAMMRGDYPPYYFNTCPWLIANKGMGNNHAGFEHQAWYSYTRLNGQQPVVQAMMDLPKQVRPAYVPPAPLPPPPDTTQLTDARVAEICREAGFAGNGLTLAVAVALAESGGDYMAVNTYGNDPVTSRDRGLFQINSHWHPEVTDAMAFDPAIAAREAFRISARGTEWTQWTTYTTGAYMQKWPRALAVTAEQLPTTAELKAFAYERCLGLPDNSALMREGRRLGLIPLSRETTANDGCRIITMQVFGVGSRMVALYCLMQDWSKVYQQEL